MKMKYKRKTHHQLRRSYENTLSIIKKEKYLEEKNKFWKSLGVRKDRKATVAYYILIVFLAMVVFGNMASPMIYRRVIDIGLIGVMICAIYIFARLYKISKNKSEGEENIGKK